ncbi:MAG TPA: hypothetical protein VM364_23360 [Vicinamibacterales bacterium]|nr:hypothetical protein [Vicinamibacterales bacterium]
MGTAGLELGPYAHLLDECALADPLLARLPAIYHEGWRTGHYRRMIPAGYRESLEGDENRLLDPLLRRFYDPLRTITRSPDLFSSERLRTILRMNLGTYDALVDRPFYRHAGARVQLDALARVYADGTGTDAAGVTRLTIPLAVLCDDRPGRRYLDVSLESDDLYELTFLKQGRQVGKIALGPVPEYRRAAGLASYLWDVPADARRSGFDTILVTPVKGEGTFAIGHLLLDGYAPTDPMLQQRLEARQTGAAR